MKTKNVKPNPAPARDAVVGVAKFALRNEHQILEIWPIRVKVIDFYPLPPSHQQRRRHGNGN